MSKTIELHFDSLFLRIPNDVLIFGEMGAITSSIDGRNQQDAINLEVISLGFLIILHRDYLIVKHPCPVRYDRLDKNLMPRKLILSHDEFLSILIIYSEKLAGLHSDFD